MPGLERHHWRSTDSRSRVLVDSPDSVIFYSSGRRSSERNNSNNAFLSGGGSLFSSAPGSVADRCSFGSDYDSLFRHPSLLVQNLAGRSGGPGPDPDPEKRCSRPFPFPDITTLSPHKNPPSKANEGEEEKEEGQQQEESLDPSKHSFSHALRECQNRRFRSEAHSSPGRKPGRRRLASLDLKSRSTDAAAAVFSPRFFLGNLTAMKKSSAASFRSKTGTFPSPGTPNYRQSAAEYQKGWSSERVPLPTNASWRYLGGDGGAVLPFNNGRTLPSKWEDAEKWILSPVSGDGVGKPSVLPPHHRRPKSKSGPLGPPTYLSLAASPLAPCFDSRRVGGFNASSPFLAGVPVMDRGSCGSGSSGRGGGGGSGGGGGGGERSSSANTEPYIMRSASVHGWSDTVIEPCSSLPSSQGTTIHDEKSDSTREAGTMISPAVLRKDMATQMSPKGSSESSPKERPSFSPSTPSSHPIEELKSHFSKLEVRDVQVDDRVTVTRWSKKHIARGSDRRLTNIIEWKKKTVETKAASSGWKVAETAKCISKYKREEAKITAWENLQKAKAEAAIRKLEMKLEKKRSSSMDKILNKLRSAQRKAQEMRSAVTTSQTHQVTRPTMKRASYFRKSGQISSLSGCFTCHAF